MKITPLRFWLLLTSGIIGIFILLRPILLPFLMGFAIAYLFNPLIHKMEGYLSRSTASLMVLFIFTIVFISLVFLLYPLLQTQLIEFIHWIPEALQKVNLFFNESILPSLKGFVTVDHLPKLLQKSLGSLGQTLGLFGQIVSQVFLSGAALFNIVSLFFISPIVAYYCLREWPKITHNLDQLIPRPHLPVIHHLLLQMDEALSGFIRGQLGVCLVLSLYYGLCLTLLGIHFGLIIGFLTGLLSFVPFFGFLVGLFTSFSIAFFQFSTLPPLVVLGIVFAVGQILENYYLFPIFVGEKVNLHPVWMIFALLAFSNLFGFFGALLAIPLAAILGVVVRFALDNYFKSHFYLR